MKALRLMNIRLAIQQEERESGGGKGRYSSTLGKRLGGRREALPDRGAAKPGGFGAPGLRLQLQL